MDPMPFGRYRRMQISEGLVVLEPSGLGHEAFTELQHAIGPVDEATEDHTRIGIDGSIAAFIKQPFGFRRALSRREIQKREEIARLVMRAGFFELCPPLGID